MVRPGWTPGPSHGVASTTEAASQAARSAGLFAWRVATRAASRTARPSSRSLAALRNALASAVTEIVGGSDPDACPGSRSRWIHGRPPRHRVAEGRRLVEARPDDEERVGGIEPLADRGRRAEAGHPEVERVIVGDDVGPPPGGDDRDLEQLGELRQLGRGPGAQDAAAGEDDRPLGRGAGTR